MPLVAPPTGLTARPDIVLPQGRHTTTVHQDVHGRLWVQKDLSTSEIRAEATAVVLAEQLGVRAWTGAATTTAWFSELLDLPRWRDGLQDDSDIYALAAALTFDQVVYITDRHEGNLLRDFDDAGRSMPVLIDHEAILVCAGEVFWGNEKTVYQHPIDFKASRELRDAMRAYARQWHGIGFDLSKVRGYTGLDVGDAEDAVAVRLEHVPSLVDSWLAGRP